MKMWLLHTQGNSHSGRLTLLILAKKDFGKQPSDAIQKLLTKKSDTFMMEVPLFVMDFGKMAIPQVWPLLGAGVPLNVAYYKSPLDASQVGHVERENCDILFLSWLLRYKEVKELQMETAVAQFQKAATSVSMHFSLRVSEADKVAHAYQLKEDEEKEMLTRTKSDVSAATALMDYMDHYRITWASGESKMTVSNIRLHLRILRRLSLAVLDPSSPAYPESALYFFDRNEEIFWPQGAAGAAARSALPNLDDLRMAATNLHILLLRGYNVKMSQRGIGELAKGLVLYSKIPAALIPRFPKYTDLLAHFVDFKTFHLKYPVNLSLEGTAVDDCPESLDKMLNEVLVPLYTFKKHSGVLGGGAPLSIAWVKAILPELEQIYAQECARESMSLSGTKSTAGVDNLQESEKPRNLRVSTKKKKADCLTTMATEFVHKNAVLLHWNQNQVIDHLMAHPLCQDGAAKLFTWQAGLDATKDPMGRQSVYRMKACADEQRMLASLSATARMMTEADSAIFVSGRNNLISKDLKKELNCFKPKLGLKEMSMEPDEEQYLSAVHGEGRSAVGSIDPRDVYFHVVKTPKQWKDRKPAARRFVPGNTAFKTMSKLPVLSKQAMLKASSKEREAIFRGVTGSDRWSPNKKTNKYDVDDDDEDEAENVARDRRGP
ncbi:unnamed protein product [Effrenium voratum]|nr:unnamed protein product [Effrenium voratum]